MDNLTLEIHPTHIKVVGADEALNARITNDLSYDVPGAFFALKAHKKKHPEKKSWCSFCHWDGKKSLYENGNLALGFHDRITGTLVEWNVPFDVKDCRPPKPSKQYEWHCSADLRDYQREIVDSMLHKGQGVISAATGSGKSIIAAAAICELGLPALIVVPTKLLLGQFVETLKDFTDVPAGIIGSGKHTEGLVQVAIAKSLVTDTPVHPDVLTKDVILIDECHYSSAETWQQVLDNCPAHYRFGFSATPYRAAELEDNMLVGMCGSVIADVGVAELQQSGHLAQSEIRVVRIKCGYDRMVYDETEDDFGNAVGWREANYAEKYRQGIMHPYRNEQVAKIVNHHARQGHKVLVTISFIEHAEQLIPMFDGDVIFLSGKDNAKHTEEKRLLFGQQSGGICIGTSIVDTGFNVPEIDVLVLAGGGEFDGRTVQRLGRGLRPTPGKDKVIVYDIKDDDKPMFLYHSKSRVKAYEGVGQAVTEYESFADVLAEEEKRQKQLRLLREKG